MGKIICRLSGVTYQGRQDWIKQLMKDEKLKVGTQATPEYFYYNHVPACRVLIEGLDLGNIPNKTGKMQHIIMETLTQKEIISKITILSIDTGTDGIIGIGLELTIEKGEATFK